MTEAAAACGPRAEECDEAGKTQRHRERAISTFAMPRRTRGGTAVKLRPPSCTNSSHVEEPPGPMLRDGPTPGSDRGGCSSLSPDPRVCADLELHRPRALHAIPG